MRKIDRKNIPTKLPGLTTLVAWLAMDYWHAAGWVWGVVLTLLGIVWIGAIVDICKSKSVDIFEGK